MEPQDGLRKQPMRLVRSSHACRKDRVNLAKELPEIKNHRILSGGSEFAKVLRRLSAAQDLDITYQK
jgi:hypothetical protein